MFPEIKNKQKPDKKKADDQQVSKKSMDKGN